MVSEKQKYPQNSELVRDTFHAVVRTLTARTFGSRAEIGLKSKAKVFSTVLIGVVVLLIGATLVASHHKSAPNSTTTASPTPTDVPWPTPTSEIAGSVKDADVYTFVCESTDQKPDTEYLACADGNEGIQDIKWSAWNQYGAQGSGTYYVNNCNPDCADGKFSYKKVNLGLTHPIQMGKKVYLRDLWYGPTTAPIDMTDGDGQDMSEMWRLFSEGKN